MKYPKIIKVLGEEIRIVPVKSWAGHKNANDSLAGRYYHDTRTIYILSTRPEWEQLRTLHHELNHAVLIATGLDQNLSDSQIEIIAQSFATHFVQLKEQIKC